MKRATEWAKGIDQCGVRVGMEGEVSSASVVVDATRSTLCICVYMGGVTTYSTALPFVWVARV